MTIVAKTAADPAGFATSKPGDPVVIAGIGALLAGAAVAASLVPGTRATRVDPVTVLRAE